MLSRNQLWYGRDEKETIKIIEPTFQNINGQDIWIAQSIFSKKFFHITENTLITAGYKTDKIKNETKVDDSFNHSVRKNKLLDIE